MPEYKESLRQKLKAIRRSLSPSQLNDKSRSICGELMSMGWQSELKIHFYLPIQSQNEVDIQPFISYLKDKPNIELFTNREIDGQWKVIPWQSDQVFNPMAFDVVIVSMLGFSEGMHRLGYGGGFYDRFLSSQEQAQKIGVCFNDLKLSSLPVEPHDISMDIIITESVPYR
jgi:5-formyltetrahydrofolate cyclo-ligase